MATEHSQTSPRKQDSGITDGDRDLRRHYDNDGWDDIFVTYFGKNLLYHNNGDGTLPKSPRRPG